MVKTFVRNKTNPSSAGSSSADLSTDNGAGLDLPGSTLYTQNSGNTSVRHLRRIMYRSTLRKHGTGPRQHHERVDLPQDLKQPLRVGCWRSRCSTKAQFGGGGP